MKLRSMQTEDMQKIANSLSTKFKINRSSIEEMYKDDRSIGNNVDQTRNDSTSLGTLTIDGFNSNYYNTNNMSTIRTYSREAYAFYPIYSSIVDSLKNMFYWRYTFYPRSVKEKATNADYQEIYYNMAEVVDGLSLETTFPQLLGKLLIDGSLFLTTVKRTGSKTVSTVILPPEYCRITGVTQFGTNVFQFDFAYFDDQGFTKEQLDILFTMYPPEMRTLYDTYKSDTKLRWQKLNPKFSAGFVLNDKSFPTYLRSLGAIMQYDHYRSNELERSDQQLIKIIAHKMPTWEDKLVVEIPEMTALHKTMSKVLTRNKNVRMLTTFGDLDVLSIGEDQTKENKTLANAYSAIYNVDGENSHLYDGDTKESLEFSLRRKESIVWKYVQDLMAFYNLTINNQFNFKGYQCSINMLPLSVYNYKDMILQYKEGATLGASKLEYIVGLGTKQVDISSKIELEEFLKLKNLTPLSTSYTGGANAAGMVDNKTSSEGSEDNTTQPEVQNE